MSPTAASIAVLYLGASTRYNVALDAGGELTVIEQNRESAGRDELRQQGRPVSLAWQKSHIQRIGAGNRMTAAAVDAPSVSLSGRLSTYLLSAAARRCLLLLLVPPLLWLGVVYLGSLLALLLQSFFYIDDFTGQVVHEFTLRTLGELFTAANLSVIWRTFGHGGAGDDRLRRDRLSRCLLHGAAMPASAGQGAVLCRHHAAALVELSGAGLCLEAAAGQGRRDHLDA